MEDYEVERKLSDLERKVADLEYDVRRYKDEMEQLDARKAAKHHSHEGYGGRG